MYHSSVPSFLCLSPLGSDLSLFISIFFSGRVSHIPGWPRTAYVVKDDADLSASASQVLVSQTCVTPTTVIVNCYLRWALGRIAQAGFKLWIFLTGISCVSYRILLRLWS